MKYSIEIIIDKPIEEVTKLFLDMEFMKKWQEGLIDYQLITGNNGEINSTHELTYACNNGTHTMTATLLKNQVPDYINYLYSSGSMKSYNNNSFYQFGLQTKWIQENIFTTDLIMILLTPFTKKRFIRKTTQGMNNFKAEVEKID